MLGFAYISQCKYLLITDYCKYLVKSKVIPYLEDDDKLEFGEYEIFMDDDELQEEEDEEEED